MAKLKHTWKNNICSTCGCRRNIGSGTKKSTVYFFPDQDKGVFVMPSCNPNNIKRK